MYVNLKYKHKGLAAKLMKRSLELCKDRGIKTVFLKCLPTLVDFYKKFGFIMADIKDEYYIMSRDEIINPSENLVYQSIYK